MFPTNERFGQNLPFIQWFFPEPFSPVQPTVGKALLIYMKGKKKKGGIICLTRVCVAYELKFRPWVAVIKGSPGGMEMKKVRFSVLHTKKSGLPLSETNWDGDTQSTR